MKPISDVAAELGIAEEHVHLYGRDMAKIAPAALSAPRTRSEKSRLVLVSAITPTPAGEGKTTTSIGLSDALRMRGESVCVALREPSMGPCFGIKGGGTGGGKAQLVPSDRINLHFTGDLHAVSAANNLLAAAIDNHLHFDNQLELDSRRILWRRVLDVNDRSLRDVTIGLGGAIHGVPRETGFDITAASEIMAMLCLCEDEDDLRARLDGTLIGYTRKREPVLAGSLGITGALLAILRDAMMPNLVQTAEGTPAMVHGGPFANIAHGCNSVLATRMAMHHADWVITEAGFGFDLGAEKFFDIKCRLAGIDPAAVVLVASMRALKMHGGMQLGELEEPSPAAVQAGLGNLEKHIESIRIFTEVPIVALNRFAADTDEEIAVLESFCRHHDVPMAVATHFVDGGAGATALAEAVVEHAEKVASPFRPLYELDVPVPDKIRAVAQAVYGARDVAYTKRAQRDLENIKRLGYSNLPICIAKTQNSLSDDPKLRGRPRDFEITVGEIQINAGAGFLVVITGNILRMPGLPRKPQAENIDVARGEITGLR